MAGPCALPVRVYADKNPAFVYFAVRICIESSEFTELIINWFANDTERCLCHRHVWPPAHRPPGTLVKVNNNHCSSLLLEKCRIARYLYISGRPANCCPFYRLSAPQNITIDEKHKNHGVQSTSEVSGLITVWPTKVRNWLVLDESRGIYVYNCTVITFICPHKTQLCKLSSV